MISDAYKWDIKKTEKKFKEDIKQIRQIVSKDFHNNTVDYFGYLIFHRFLEMQGKNFFKYINILEKMNFLLF